MHHANIDLEDGRGMPFAVDHKKKWTGSIWFYILLGGGVVAGLVLYKCGCPVPITRSVRSKGPTNTKDAEATDRARF